MLEAIYAAVARGEADDALRRAYADLLLERGDPRGQFIALQCARALTGGDASAEEQRLLTEHWRAWVGAPAALFFPQNVSFVRGFWDSAEVSSGSAPALMLAGADTWATVTNLTVFRVARELFAALFRGPVHRSVRRLTVDLAGTLEQVAHWEQTEPAVRHLTVLAPRWYRESSDAARFPSLTRLERIELVLMTGADLSSPTEWLVTRPGGEEGTVPELALSLIGDPGVRLPSPTELIAYARRATSAAVRVFEISVHRRYRLQVERDGRGEWHRLRVVLCLPAGQRVVLRQDIEWLERFHRSLPHSQFRETIVEVPERSEDDEVEERLRVWGVPVSRPKAVIEPHALAPDKSPPG